ncbi:unnamed protein product [Prunus armeniaca]
MLIKVPEGVDHIKNLIEAFNLLRQYCMKLNSSKCTLAVSADQFLGYLVAQQGIEVHPSQSKVILEMKLPSTMKEIQSLTVKAVTLNRFLSRSTEKFRPFFKALKKGQKDKWDEECETCLALIREELGAKHPVFYTSKALLDVETHYPKFDKLILALAVSTRKLRPYNQANRIIDMIDFPLRSILHSLDASQ